MESRVGTELESWGIRRKLGVECIIKTHRGGPGNLDASEEVRQPELRKSLQGPPYPTKDATTILLGGPNGHTGDIPTRLYGTSRAHGQERRIYLIRVLGK